MLLSELKRYLPLCSIMLIISSSSFCSQTQPDTATKKQWSIALTDGNIKKVIQILNQFPGLLHTLSGGHTTPLGIAAYYGHLQLALFLLERGANINQRQSHNNSALHQACFSSKSSSAMVEYLINVDADIHAKNQSLETPLFLCRNVAWARLLLEHGADVTVQNISGDTLLTGAISYGNLELIAYYLRLRPDFLNACNSRKRNSLYRAASLNKKEHVKALLRAGAVDTPDTMGQTALYIAAEQDFSEIVVILLKWDPDIHAKDNRGQTPMHILANECHQLNRHPFLPMISQEQRHTQRRAAVKALLQYGTPLESAETIAAIRQLKSRDFDPEKIILDARAKVHKDLLNVQTECGLRHLPHDLEALIIAFAATPKLPRKTKEDRGF